MDDPAGPRSPRSPLPALVLVVVGALVHAPGLRGAFLLDDFGSLHENASLRDPTDLGALLSPPADTTVAGRPVLNVSFGLDHALYGLDPFGYHVTNLVVHLAAGLLLYGLVRRTRPSAPGLAFAVALLWLVHPLQTQSVAYVVQRAESLMGLFYLATLYCVARRVGGEGRGWSVGAVAACALGMGTKEVMVSAPLVALLYDRTFAAGSLGAAWRRHKALWSGLAATWIPLVLLVATTPRGDSVRADLAGAGVLDYARTQLAVVPYYLRLALFPRGLAFDRDWPIAPDLARVALPGLFLVALVAVTLVALVRRHWSGFLGAAFFLILAPTSSLVPIVTEVAAEHRMYLPLACVVALVVAAGRVLLARLGTPRAVGPLLVALAASALGATTFARGRLYRDPLQLWERTLAAQPDNARAHATLSVLLREQGRFDEARAHAEEALRLGRGTVDVHFSLGTLAGLRGDHEAAAAHFAEAVRLDPDEARAHHNLAVALTALGRAREAAEHERRALELDPGYADAHAGTLVVARVLAAHPDAAVRDGPLALALIDLLPPASGEDPVVLDVRAAALAECGRFAEAADAAQRARTAAERAGQGPFAMDIERRRALYLAGRPFRMGGADTSPPR